MKSNGKIEFQVDTFANILQKYSGGIGLSLNITVEVQSIAQPITDIPDWINLFEFSSSNQKLYIDYIRFKKD